MNRPYLMAAALAFALAALPLSGALAQGMGMGPGMGQGGMGRGGLLPDPAKLPDLKARLGITAEQEAAWSSYAEGVTAANEMRAQMRAEAQSQPMPQRMESRADRRAAGAQVHEDLNQRRAALAELLRPEQRALLDREAPPLPPPPGPR
jgi:hypothetical protein